MAAKATDAHMRATAKWEAANYDKVLVRFPRGTADRIRATGESLNGFTVTAVLDRLRLVEGGEHNND